MDGVAVHSTHINFKKKINTKDIECNGTITCDKIIVRNKDTKDRLCIVEYNSTVTPNMFKSDNVKTFVYNRPTGGTYYYKIISNDISEERTCESIIELIDIAISYTNSPKYILYTGDKTEAFMFVKGYVKKDNIYVAI